MTQGRTLRLTRFIQSLSSSRGTEWDYKSKSLLFYHLNLPMITSYFIILELHSKRFNVRDKSVPVITGTIAATNSCLSHYKIKTYLFVSFRLCEVSAIHVPVNSPLPNQQKLGMP